MEAGIIRYGTDSPLRAGMTLIFLFTPHVEAEPEACVLEALDIARKQQAKSWELCASPTKQRPAVREATSPHTARQTLTHPPFTKTGLGCPALWAGRC
jgi:hypothetical protein